MSTSYGSYATAPYGSYPTAPYGYMPERTTVYVVQQQPTTVYVVNIPIITQADNMFGVPIVPVFPVSTHRVNTSDGTGRIFETTTFSDSSQKSIYCDLLKGLR